MVLLHVAGEARLAGAVAAAPDAAHTLVDLLQMFRDKADICCLASELLGRLIAADEDTRVRVSWWLYGLLLMHVGCL